MATVEKAKTLIAHMPDPAVAAAMRTLADERGMTADALIILALREWLERQEELEDIAAMDEVMGEPTIPWEQARAELHAAWEDRRDE